MAKFLDALQQMFVGTDQAASTPLALENALEKCKNALKLRDKRVNDWNDIIVEERCEGRTEEIEGFEYRRDLTIWTFEEAHTEGVRRAEYIRSLDTKQKREDELTLCADGLKGTLHWFDHWAWTHDPRMMPLTTLPFKLFEKQVEFVTWYENLIFKYQQPGHCDKSRDMGMTWAIIAVLVKNWRFQPRFDVLVGSKNEDAVDSKGRDDTLMEKGRFLIRLMPAWMHPVGFSIDKHMPWLNILNPETGSFIAGESANDNFARQGRYSHIFIDEFQIYPEGGYSAYTSLSESATSNLVGGTPAGKLNKFADIKFNTKVRQFSMHWKDHPRKDDRWYRMKSKNMDDAMIEQEININYDASQVGLVFRQWQPLYSVITWSEFVMFYGEKALDEDGNPMIPADWLVSVAQDVGTTEDSRNVTTYGTRPNVRDKLNDSFFLFHESMAQLGLAPDEIMEGLYEFEKMARITKRVTNRWLSHEASSEQLTYEKQGFDWEKWDTDYNAGLAQCRNYMRVVDLDKPNPFRAHLKDAAGNPMMGRSRWYVIVEDKQGFPKWHEGMKKWVLPDPKNSAGFARARVEIQMYHIPRSEAGKPVRQQRPHHAFCDAMDTWRGLSQELPPIVGLTDEEKIDSMLPEHLRRSELAKLNEEDFAMAWMTRQLEAAEISIPQNKHWRDMMYGKRKGTGI